MPLIVKGARQIGKTDAIINFARNNYKYVVDINFVLQKEYKTIFDNGFEVDTIIHNISMINNDFYFKPGETLLFFDEIQDCINCATSLKSFNIDKRYDVILPFSVSREEAEKIINDNVLKFKKIVDMEFIENLNSQHIKGVYFPYALVDANAHCIFDGEGLLKTNSKKNYGVFDYIFGKLCEVYREFDINIDDLSLETYSEIMNLNDNEKFNQIINSIMPFDTENCVPFKSNYLIGYSSEKRDINLENIASKINNQLEKICKTVVTENIKQKYCSINWERKKIDFKGKKIIIGYFPIWLYSYEKIISGKRKIFYIAVNGRTKEINYVLPFKISILKKLETFMTVSVSLFSLLVLLKFYDNSFSSVSFILLSVSFIIYITVSSILYYYYYDKMRERHFYEHETKYTVLNMISKDKIIENSKINVNNDNNN